MMYNESDSVNMVNMEMVNNVVDSGRREKMEIHLINLKKSNATSSSPSSDTEPQSINHLLEQLSASGLDIRQANTSEQPDKVPPNTKLEVKPKITKPQHHSRIDNVSALIEDVKTQPYFKMFMDALQKEGISGKSKKSKSAMEFEDGFNITMRKTSIASSLLDPYDSDKESDNKGSVVDIEVEPEFGGESEPEIEQKMDLEEYEEDTDTEEAVEPDQQGLFLEQLGMEPAEGEEEEVSSDHPRRPGLRRMPQTRKTIDPDFAVPLEPLKKKRRRGPRGPYKKKKEKKGKPKVKCEREKAYNFILGDGEVLGDFDVAEFAKLAKMKLKRGPRQPKDEVKAIEKDATKELMEALMKSAILKGKVASIQPTVRPKVPFKPKKSKAKKKDPAKAAKQEELLNIEKSDHTPRYKYLTGFEDRPYSCSYCQGRFTKKSYLKQHIRTHTGEKPHQCEVCHRKFRQQAALKRHMMTHTGEKPFKCSLCIKCYSDKAVLNEHMRVHTGEKPFLCHICTKSFAYTFSFKQHMKRHRGDRDHECTLCNAKFYTASSLTTHVKKSHTGIRDAVCDICGKAFVDKSDLSRHKRKIHGGNNNMVKHTNNIPPPSINNNNNHNHNNQITAATPIVTTNSFSRPAPPPPEQFTLMGAFTQHLMGAATGGDPSQGTLQGSSVWPTGPPPTPFPPANIPWGGSSMWGQGNFAGYRP